MTNTEAIYLLNTFYRAMAVHSEFANSYEHPRRIYMDSTAHNIDLVLQAIDIAIKALEERPKGKWIESQEEFEDAFIIFKHECSNCKEITFGGGNFCPNCGADMRGEEE